MHLQCLGAVEEVTGSCHLIEVNGHRILLDCGMIQGRAADEARNRDPFPFDPEDIDAVILSHAHIDHCGRLPLLVKSGFTGPIYTHNATSDLCDVMLRDSAYLAERDAVWENRKRERKHLPLVEALYDIEDVENTLPYFQGLEYEKSKEILPGVTVRLQDAGHIIGSAIVELWLEENGVKRKIVFSGDLGQNGVPILRDVAIVTEADYVIMESTYGDRQHQTMENTVAELKGILDTAFQKRGNVLIPAFAVGRTQEILYIFKKFYKEWDVDRWQIYLDSPMAIKATKIYVKHHELHDKETRDLWGQQDLTSLLPNLEMSESAEESMYLNTIQSGAIFIAGSGMCNGGRIKHHLKYNVWRRNCHVVIAGFQAKGTLGRALVDGAKRIRLWGETIKVAAKIHTVGGLSAHADQDGLCEWYQHFKNRPPLLLVHGEPSAQEVLATRLQKEFHAPVKIAQPDDKIDLIKK